MSFLASGESASLGLAHQRGREGSELRQARLQAKLGVYISDSQERQLVLMIGFTPGRASTLPQALQSKDIRSKWASVLTAPATGTGQTPAF